MEKYLRLDLSMSAALCFIAPYTAARPSRRLLFRDDEQPFSIAPRLPQSAENLFFGSAGAIGGVRTSYIPA